MQSAAQKQPVLDVVEISAEGRAASALPQEQQTDAVSEGYQAEVEGLSGYTDTELKQMYYKGEITRQEYEDETGKTLE